MIKQFLLACALALCACGVGSETPPGNPDGGTDGAPGGFGAACTIASDTSTECISGVCTNTFDQVGHPVCSQKCTLLSATDPSCPAGAVGQKCNMKGYCRP